jgi:hypothetical protein
LVDNSKADRYLRRNASGPRKQDEGEDGDGNEDDEGDDGDGKNENKNKCQEGYEDDYNQNAGTVRNAQNAGASSRPSTMTNKRTHPSEPQMETRRGYDNDPRPKKKQKDNSHDHASTPALLPPQPTTADICRADKAVAKEKARDKALGASRDKIGAKPTSAPKGKDDGKGKGKEHAIVEEDNDSDAEVSMPLDNLTIFTNILFSPFDLPQN